MRRTSRTIVILAAPLLMTLGFGCAKNAPASYAPDGDGAMAYEDYGAEAEYADEYYEDDYDDGDYASADGALAGSDSAPAPVAPQDPAAEYEYDYDEDLAPMAMSADEPEPMMADAVVERASRSSKRHSRKANRRSRKDSRRASKSKRSRTALRSNKGAPVPDTRRAQPIVAEPSPPPQVAVTPVPAPDHDTEAYSHIQENDFIAVADDPRSTFSIDVDTASYSNTRRFIREGRLPPPDAVRIEELVNYFDYDYPQPRGADPFSVNTEVAPCPWNPDHRLVHVGLQGKDVAAKEVPPRNLVFLLDVSGSMSDSDKLPLLKQGMRMLADQIREQDRVSIVVYAGASGVVLDPTSSPKHIRAALDCLEAGGSTAGAAGIQLAYDIASANFIKGGINRIFGHFLF